jgi:iron complex outermembrane receptor protein
MLRLSDQALLFTLVSSIGICSPIPGFAEETPATASATSEASVERIEVTGSHIKRLAIEGASPVQTVTRRDLEKSGYNSVSDVLRDANVSSFGGMREQSGSNAAGNAQVSLRGLGSTNTLVLLNGQRLPSDAVTGAVDLNMIPMAAVERIEILKDGASAIYGSDALGGVVNIITRSDFQGTQTRVTQTAPELKGGARTEVSIVNGINKGSTNVVTVAQFRNNEVSYARDREWSKNQPSFIGGPGSGKSASGTWFADPSCPADQVVTNPQGSFCTFNPAAYMTALPALQQFGLMSEANTELNSTVKLTARAGGSRRKVNWSYAAAPGTFKIPGSVADTLGPGGTPLPGAVPGEDLNIRYRLTDLGTRDTETITHSYNFLVGSTIQMSDWQLVANVSHNGVHGQDRGLNGYALTPVLENAIRTGAFNPFNRNGSRAALDAARYVPTENTMSLVSAIDVKAVGPLATLGENDISLAVGSMLTRQKYIDAFDEKSVAGEVFGNSGSSGGGQRRTQALYSELLIPLSPKLELTAAGRFDNYSDFGNTTNPKGAISYRPVPQVLLRGSVGTGFKAPLMNNLYAATSRGFPTFIDQTSCNREKAAGGATPSCLPQQYEVERSGNTGLKEERSFSYNVGAIIEPTKDFSFGADVFATKMNNVVGIDYNDAMLAEAQGVDLSRRGVIVRRDAQGYIDNITAPMQNLSSQSVSGVDLSAAIRPMRHFQLSSEHSQLFAFRQEGFPGVGAQNALGRKGMPRWRNTAALNYSPNDRHDVTLSALTIAGQEKAVREMGTLSDYTTFDVSYALKTRELGTFSFGVRNIMGSTPPLDDSAPTDAFNETLYDQTGRTFIVGYQRTF